MKLKKWIVTSLLMCMLPVSVFAKDIKIGVSMAHFDDNFLTILRQAMQGKMKEIGGVSGQFEDAKGDIAQQIQQVENFVSQGVDAIILNPVDTQGVKPMIKLAENAKIPLVFINRRPEATLPAGMAYVGSDSKLAGKLQMEELAKLMNGKGNVMILLGELSSEATRDRTRGVEEVAAQYPDIRIIDKQTAKFFRKEAVDVTTDWILSGQKIDAIASNNDEMAIGAILALKQAKKSGVLVAGIDGTPDALEFIKKGDLSLSIFQDAKGQGEGAVQTAIQLVKGEKVDSSVMIPYQLITGANYQQFAGKNNK
ncbi:MULTISPECIES: sugar ABC transporter substrate-binding protein [unclassified Serratia (in: enterobacteria)]|uniref:sugar ABC transporter substrate-binding protein n=1 Tax=unclassified Serratia (in: enterobacteria) TaxID=2647522 RepID=UPI00050145F2|nr:MULTISPECIES: sugar ABC transporter substrate-binding protein [unclassified Serratia (in: enterobacteria)]KFK92862.1 rhizopine-binding protein [Serratia sp. Ag2]KFK94154.1 rhizopine-binding protein [Serratia sp. Ag1]